MSASLQAKIAEVFDEPGCDINQAKSEKERKKGCTRQLNPGGAAGGCAFDGAKIAPQPIVDVAHLVHGPIACEGNGWDNRHSASSGPQAYRTGYINIIGEYNLSGELWQVKPLLDALGVRQHDGVLQVDDQHRHQDAGALGHPLLRGLVLRHQRHEHHAA